MTYDKHDIDEDRHDAEALARAEKLILELATDRGPRSLSELRDLLDREAGGEDRALLRVALWSLLNENRLELASDRTLRVAG
jgi:hypothetical protein